MRDVEDRDAALAQPVDDSANSRSASALDSDDVGSSRISTFGSCAMARAIATICRSASDRSLMRGIEIDVQAHAGGDGRGLAAHPARIEE